MIDFAWMSNGGLLLDGSGDLALSSVDGTESLFDMIRTRVKAGVDGWQLYRIGAGLSRFLGEAITPELELSIKRAVSEALVYKFLRPGSFDIQTLRDGNSIIVLVYINEMLAARATLRQGEPAMVE